MQTKTKVKILIPNVQKYTLLYKKANGDQQVYRISPPIDRNAVSFTAYAFGKGIRTFKFENIIDLN